MGENGILQTIDEAIKDEHTPTWGKAILLCQRDDHIRLREHLEWHARLGAVLNKVAVAVLCALGVSVVAWLLGGRFPAVFP